MEKLHFFRGGRAATPLSRPRPDPLSDVSSPDLPLRPAPLLGRPRRRFGRAPRRRRHAHGRQASGGSSCAEVAAFNLCGSTLKTAFGAPAAAQTTACDSRLGSM